VVRVYGADFSGAMNPKIFYAYGDLDGSRLTIKDYVVCDDRLDLYQAIVSLEVGIWGLDFPFSMPADALPILGFDNRDEMLDVVTRMTRKEFARFIDVSLPDYPRKCEGEHSLYCRATDVAVNAHSVFKTVNPNLRVMMYAGLKLIHYLSQHGVNVYPFGEYSAGQSNVHEIYPSYVWQKAGLKRSTDINRFIEQFNALGLVSVSCEFDTGAIDNQDLADSIVACVMMATAYVTQEMSRGWDYQLPIFTEDEWGWRSIEGLIVRF